MPEAAPALDHAVADLRAGCGSASGRRSAGRRRPSPAAGRTGASRSSAPGATAPVSRARSSASRIRFWANPRPRYSGSVPTHITPFIGSVRRAVADRPLGQVDVADDPAVDLDQQPLVGPIRRVAQGAQERLAVGPVEDVEQRLVDGLVVGLGAEAELDRTATEREPDGRRGSFHRDDRPSETRPRAIRSSQAEPGRHGDSEPPLPLTACHSISIAKGTVDALRRNLGATILRDFFRDRSADRSAAGTVRREPSRSRSRVSRMEHEGDTRGCWATRVALQARDGAASRSSQQRRARSPTTTAAAPRCSAGSRGTVRAARRGSRPARRSPLASPRPSYGPRRSTVRRRWRSGLNVRSRSWRSIASSRSGVAGSVAQAEPEGHRERQEAGRLEPEEAAGDLVAQLVVLRPADAVDEQVAEQERANSVVVRARVRSRIPLRRQARAAARRRSRPRDRARAGARGTARPRRRSAAPSSARAAGPAAAGAAAGSARQTQNGASSQSPSRPRAGTGWCLLRIP